LRLGPNHLIRGRHLCNCGSAFRAHV
jgi:hypothetical protein